MIDMEDGRLAQERLTGLRPRECEVTLWRSFSLTRPEAIHGHAHVVAELVERGADVDRLNDRGRSPIAGAVFTGEDDVVRVLAAAGADPGAGHPTALKTATMFGREDLLSILQPR